MEQVIDPGISEEIEVPIGDARVHGRREVHAGPQSPASFNIGYVQTGYYGRVDIQPASVHLTELGMYARLLVAHGGNPAVRSLDADISPSEAAELARVLDGSGSSFAWSLQTIPVRGDATES